MDIKKTNCFLVSMYEIISSVNICNINIMLNYLCLFLYSLYKNIALLNGASLIDISHSSALLKLHYPIFLLEMFTSLLEFINQISKNCRPQLYTETSKHFLNI